MRILLASSEVHPYSKTGGLADMVGALGKALARAGHEARIVTPLYRASASDFRPCAEWIGNSTCRWGHNSCRRNLVGGGRKTVDDFFRWPAGLLSARRHLPGEHVSYPDNAARYIFFSKCVANLARYLPWQPDFVHVNDWQAGLVPALMLHQRRAEGWGNPPPVCLTIHNLAYQGTFPAAAFALTNLPEEFFSIDGVEFYKQLNSLKAGIAFADAITTVSPRYAREITTEEFGCGLDGLLRRRQNRLFGILNGVDHEEWDTCAIRLSNIPIPQRVWQANRRTRSSCKRSWVCRWRRTHRYSAPSPGLRNKKVWTSNWARSRKC